jgi:hypothetical protein
MNGDFAPDDQIRQIAEAYALDAVDIAKSQFKINLDFSDQSITRVEQILDFLHNDRVKSNPTQEQIFNFAKVFGSYIGEVYRRNHGATWGTVTMGRDSFPGLQATAKGNLFWPWGKVQNRITQGAEDNVAVYYRVLLTSPAQ